MTTLIYGLDDPRTHELRYIGYTRRSLTRRLRDHLTDSHICHRTSWIKNLKADHLTPGIFEIESVPDIQAAEAECFWIAYFKYIGANLTNGTEGGEGVRATEGVRAKMRAAKQGTKLSEEHRRKIGATHKGMRRGAEAKQRMGQAQRAISQTAEWRAKNSAVRMGHQVSAETRTKISASLMGKKASPETRAKLSAIRRGKKMPPRSAEHSAKIVASRRRAKQQKTQSPLF